MKLSAFKTHLQQLDELNFFLPDGMPVPAHFHITEAGLTTKHFIDCGGTIRQDRTINFQIWWSVDTDHRLSPEKLRRIISIFESRFGSDDLAVEVEYDSGTIGRYGLEWNGFAFQLEPIHTACLAADQCGVPSSKKKIALADLQKTASGCCAPGGGCC